MSTKPPLDIPLKPSVVMLWVVLIMHCLAVLALSLADVPIILKVVGGVGIAGALIVWLMRRKDFPNRLLINDMAVRLVDGEHVHEVEFAGKVFLSAWLVMLPFKTRGKRRDVLLLWDSLCSDDFRRLRALLNRA
ncbi:protein YgfX [Aurantivibrio plasticivorans]